MEIIKNDKKCVKLKSLIRGKTFEYIGKYYIVSDEVDEDRDKVMCTCLNMILEHEKCKMCTCLNNGGLECFALDIEVIEVKAKVVVISD